MRHRKKKVVLDRDSASRRALLANLAESLFLYEKIKTTQAKAKALRPLAEKIITKAKKGDLASRRLIMSKLYTDNVVKKLMEDIGPRYKERKGGYIRITKLGPRKGDGAAQAVIELV